MSFAGTEINAAEQADAAAEAVGAPNIEESVGENNKEPNTSGATTTPGLISKVKTSSWKAFHAVKWILLVVFAFIILALIASWNMRRSQKYSKEELQNIKSLVLYAAKSAEEAERIKQTDPLQALLHANYAVCYVNAAKHMVNEKTIGGLLGADVQELEQYLTLLQQSLLNTVEYQILKPSEAIPTPISRTNEQGKHIVTLNTAPMGASNNAPTPTLAQKSSMPTQRNVLPKQTPILKNRPSVFSS